MAIFYLLVPSHVSLWTLLALCLVALPLDVLRLRYRPLNSFLQRWFGAVMRDSEVDQLAGTTYLLLGVAVVVVFFPPSVALLALWFLAFADPAAATVGVKFGRMRIWGRKSLEGFLGAFVVCAVVSALYFSFTVPVAPMFWLSIVLLCAFVGALAELVSVFGIDDNFTLPILSALGIYWILLQLSSGSLYSP